MRQKRANPDVVVVPLAVQKPVLPYWYGYGGYSTCRSTNSKSKSLSESESNTMGLGHEKLDDGTVPDAAMLSRLGGRGYCVAESSAAYRTEPVAVDPEAEKPQQAAARNALMHVRALLTLCGKLLVVAIPELLRSLARHEDLDPPAGAEVSKISARQSIVGCVLIKSALRI